MKNFQQKFFTCEDIVVWIIKVALWGLPFVPLYVASEMLFPFISGKNFLFRIVVDVLAGLWVGLAIASPRYRPRPTLLFKLSAAFVLAIFIADILSPNPFRAFFSNYERMEGFMTIFHLWLYFLVLTSIFKTQR